MIHLLVRIFSDEHKEEDWKEDEPVYSETKDDSEHVQTELLDGIPRILQAHYLGSHQEHDTKRRVPDNRAEHSYSLKGTTHLGPRFLNIP